MMAEHDPDLFRVVEKVARVRGFRCDAYKESCLKRRLAVRMRARGVHTYAEYARVLDRDSGEFDRLLQAITVNVSKFYRNAETWSVLAQEYLPRLWESRRGAIRCWSAGCASGEEAYTVAMLLLEQARHQGWKRARSARIDATDIDEGCLRKAEEGTYREQAFEELPEPLRHRYVTAGDSPTQWQVAPAVREMVRFGLHNLTKDPAPGPPYDLILCRNVVIYFDRPTQEHLFGRMADSLAPGGYLVLGKVETLFGEAVRRRLAIDNTRERVYRRS